MIVIGDLHLRYKPIYFNAQIKFLNWVEENYKNEIIIFLGDVFDSSPHFEVYTFFQEWLRKRKTITYILKGNHDFSFFKGEYLEGISKLENVKVFFKETEIIIENNKCMMLPYIQQKDYLENLKGEYDYIFTHLTPLECAFASEGILLNLKGTYIHGHTHTSLEFFDKNNQKNYVLGVPYPTRNLEEKPEHHILEIKEDDNLKTFRFIPTPKFLDIITVKYNCDLNKLNKNFIYNIIEAPSSMAVAEKFKDFFIRSSQIEREDKEQEEENKKIDFTSNREAFKMFSNETNIGKKYENYILGYIT